MSTRDTNDRVFWDIVNRIEKYGPSEDGEFNIQNLSFSGDLDLGGNKIINLGYPASGSDAINLDYMIQFASDSEVSVPGWTAETIGDLFEDITKYILDVMGTGLISGGLVSMIDYQTLSINAGYGYINEPTKHLEINWDSTTVTIDNPSDVEFWVYVNQLGDVNVSYGAPPNKLQNIILCYGYWEGTRIGMLYQAGSMQSAMSNMAGFFENLGYFIVDNGGKVIPYTGQLKFHISPATVQRGLSQVHIPENDTSNAGSSLFYWHKTNNLSWGRDHCRELDQTVSTNVYNDVSVNVVTATGTVTFTNGSNIVSGIGTQFTTEVSVDDLVFPNNDSQIACRVASVDSDTQLTLYHNYSNDTFTGDMYIDKSLKPIPSGKWAKHLVLATLDGYHHMIYAQEYFDTEDDALNAGAPEIPENIEKTGVKLGCIVFQAGDTNLDDKIVDVRPLPFHYQIRGSHTGSGPISHGDLLDLDRPEHHPWAFLVDGTRPMTGDIDINNNDIINANNIYANNFKGGIADVQYMIVHDSGYKESESVSSNYNTTFARKLTVDITIPGLYKIEWYYNWRVRTTSYDFEARITLDDDGIVTTIGQHRQEPKDTGSDQAYTSYGFKVIEVSRSPAHIYLDFRTTRSSYPAYIWNARIMFTRIGN